MYGRKFCEKLFRFSTMKRHFECSAGVWSCTPSKNHSRKYSLERRGHFGLNLFANASSSSKSSPEGAPEALRMTQAFCNNEDSTLEIEWGSESEEQHPYPYVWLRDNCQCENCFHPTSLSRTMLFDDLDLNVTPLQAKISEDGSQLLILWSDGHSSSFGAEWLHVRSFPPNESVRRTSDYKLTRSFWGGELLDRLPTANFNDLLNEDEALLNWLHQLEVFGFVMINEAPVAYGQVKKLVDRVGFIRRTHYGAEFSVKNKPNPNNVAYSRGPLQLHTDLPYYYYKPGAQLIHCIIQYDGVGGQSLVSDGVHVAHEMKKRDPELFDILSCTQVDWTDTGKEDGVEFLKVLQQPVICLDKSGEIKRINFSHPQRDSFFKVEPSDAVKWYAALKTFHNMLYDPKYCLRFKMTPGTVQSFDNLRIVHGRTSYESGDGEREIEGCYLDWDEIRSRRRVLERSLRASSVHLC